MAKRESDPGVCIVCLRQHCNIWYAPQGRPRKGFFCMDCLVAAPQLAIVKKVYGMSDEKLGAYEEKAIEAGGDAAGQYLDEIGKFELDKLELHEWLEVGRRWLNGYADAMRTMITEAVAPF